MHSLPPKYIVTFAILFAGMIGYNALLAIRDVKMIEHLDARQQQLCQLDASYCK